ncbi:hypothetical protein KC363_g8054 [Hortaea werneckii]|uniref:Cytokinesis regulator n=1 Tax=Hortaea werneckii TaxID=91943 RepID=A0A3M7F045_HORWE|nr:hypothetical protein KC363_g8054 [Hortaea werneckii]RMY81901.1 hypothetical protein D0861_08126 [Hortaea werneckii]
MDDENWDEDFQGDIAFGNSVGTAQTNFSSRLSVHSESVAGDDDWNVVLPPPNDDRATDKAVQSAKQAGIPLPENIPQSALLGGSIKRLGKQSAGTRQKIGDDWDNDLEMPAGGLQLKPKKAPEPHEEEFDDFDDLEGSLGTRFAGTKHSGRNRSSSASAMSPSLGSATAESEEDAFGGLELPEGPMDFEAILKKRRAAEAELSDISQQPEQSPRIEQPETVKVHKKSKLLSDDKEDFLDDFELGGGEILDNRKTRFNKNLKIKNPPKPATSAQRGGTTLNFHEKPTDKPLHMRSHLPRPVSGSKQPPSRLEPVFETGAPRAIHERRQPTTTGAQLLKSKRSMPAIGSQRNISSTQKPSFIPAGISRGPQNAAQRAMPYHLRRESDPNRQGAQSPPPRPSSRLSNAYIPDTPSRAGRQNRKDVAPAALAREAAGKKTLTKPARKRNWGDGNELELFDDLPTSQVKESKYVKEPIARGPPRTGARQTPSRTDVRDAAKRAIPDRMTTPAPPRTPASPTRGFPEAHTPSYLRDTAASRIARESRLAGSNPRPRSEGPLQPLATNWKAQIAARSPHTSPSAQRQKVKRPQPTLIKNIGSSMAKTEKGMTYNPITQRWEGNENTLTHFDIPPPLQTPTPTGHQRQSSWLGGGPPPSASPPRPALIAPMKAAHGVQVNGGMVFDPRQMKWLKLKEGRDISGPISPSVTDNEEEDDAFAGIEDLKDENEPIPGAGTASGGGMASPVSMAAAGVGDVHEEFDLGPQFIRIQREEENMWRRRCELWFPTDGSRQDNGQWRWSIRDMVPQEVVAESF